MSLIPVCLVLETKGYLKNTTKGMVSLRMTSHGINPKNLISCGLALTFCISKVQTIHFEMLKKNRKTVIWRPGRSSGAKWLEEPSGEKPRGGWMLWKKIQPLSRHILSVVKMLSSRKKCYRFLRAPAYSSSLPWSKNVLIFALPWQRWGLLSKRKATKPNHL